jgi:trimethylamine--corrinoid protein Co-methyltransferase
VKALNGPGNIFRRSHFPNLTEEKCRKIHEASLEILERVGTRLFLDDAVDLLVKAGAKVSDGNLVRIKPDLVEKALETVPKRFVLYDRMGNPVMPLEGFLWTRFGLPQYRRFSNG